VVSRSALLSAALWCCALCAASGAAAQSVQGTTGSPPTRADVLRGEYGRYRANNDLLYYALDVRVDPARKTIAGSNTIRFKMLADDTRIQLELHPALTVDRILHAASPLKFTRDLSTVYVDFPSTLRQGQTYAIAFHYSGAPVEQGRFGGMAFRTDPAGRHWVTTACEDEGASSWWPNKDQWRDEPEGMRLSVAVPNGLMDVSNGRFLGKTDLGDGYTRWDWEVQYRINSYGVALNIGAYVQFSDRLGNLPLDFFVLPENLGRAKTQFAQAKPMLEIFQRYFGEYPFARDGFKLVEVPYAGMEHQSAVAYGNGFENGYLKKDFTGVGISPRFDFIIVHEAAHEWFGNSITAADVADMWIHEGFATYMEALYVEQRWGKADGIRYVNGEKPKVGNKEPVITERGIHRVPTQDMYFKGALFLHTLRSVVDDDARWEKLLKDLYRRFKYRTISTEDVVQFFNTQLGRNLTPVFDQYLRRAELPVLELTFPEPGTLAYRWRADERAFAMPVRIGTKGAWQVIEPTTSWTLMKTTLTKETVEVATDLYYVNVVK
jgi:aminopeptidase N